MSLVTLFNSEMEKLKFEMIEMPWENKNFYHIFLSQTYYFVQHSTRLLALASAHCNLEENSLHRRYAAHIGEEKAHEQIALSDLNRLSTQPLYPVLPETRNLFEVQYYKILHLHPSALLGYILALEGIASHICPAFIQKVYDAHSVSCSHFLKLHVEEDPDHVEKAVQEVMKLSPEHFKYVEENMLQSIYNYSTMMKSILQKSRELAEMKEPNEPISQPQWQ